MKKLKAAEENEKKENSRQRIEMFSGYFHLQMVSNLKIQFYPETDLKPIASYISFYVNNVSGSIFKPPASIV